MLELKDIQANLYRNGVNLGLIKIGSTGRNTCSLNVLNYLSNEEKKELDKLTQNLASFLETCSFAKQEYLVRKDTVTRNYRVIRKMGDQEADVAVIQWDNKQLYFVYQLNEGETQLCLQQINAKHVTDFYYRGDYYDGH